MPSRRRHHARTWAVALVIPALLGAALIAVPVATASTADVRGKPTGSSVAARQALADARAAFSAGQTPGAGPAARDATLVLRDLWRLRGQLRGADRAAADRLLTRPAASESLCTTSNCYHWQTSGADAVPATDADGNGYPDYVDAVVATVDSVRATYVAAGYRRPKPDGTAGGNSLTDIYLLDVGGQGLYGYCTSDMPTPDSPSAYDAWAYCVLDNDYSTAQFPTNTPRENLRVTAAHEYFHAVQFAYDYYEDRWFMEATATWAEDELYDGVDDSRQYLADSPLTKPQQPLDTFRPGAGPQYGEWIFFRFLTERLTAAQGGMPTLVRDMWRRADGAAGGPDDYSIQAVKRVLADRGRRFPSVFAQFADANRRPARTYDEGAHYPSVGPAGTFRLRRAQKDSGWKYADLRHLSSVTARFVPGTGLKSSAWRLRVSLDLPGAATAPAAVVTVYRRSGTQQVSVVPLSATGAGGKRVAFGSSRVRYVEVTLANASTRYRCWTGGAYSCQGTPRDDPRRYLVRARAVR